MKIIYSPFYDSETYLGDAPNVMGVTYVGDMGLLQQLELRAGMHLEPIAEVECEAEFHNAMKGHLKHTMFEGAAQVDPMGVASKLLRWRDVLVMAGWDGTCWQKDGNNKVSVLADIEKDFHAMGVSDCWRNVCQTYEEGVNMHGSVESIQLDCPWSEVPYLIQKTLLAIEKNGTPIERLVIDETESSALNASNIQLLDFEDVNEAYEWCAQIKELPQNTVIINRDNVQLNHTFYTWNRPLVHSSLRDSNPQLLQLFKLCMSIFSRPLNIQNLVSYLMLPMSPIPRSLRRELAYILLKKEGFGDKKMREDGKIRDDWEEAIESFDFVDKSSKAKKMPFLVPIRKDYTNGINKEELTSYIEEVKKWIQGQYADENLPQERIMQMKELTSYLNSFSIVLKPMAENVSFEDIEKIILQVYRPMNYSLQSTEAGTPNVISNIRSMAQGADTLIWLDCQEEEREHDPYDFLSAEEKNKLQERGSLIPDFDLHLKVVRTERIRLLNRCEQILLVQSHFNGTTRLGEHSIIAEVRQAWKQMGQELKPANADKIFAMVETEPFSDNIEVLSPVKALDLGKINYPGRKESNTSMDSLINLPFNYVMEHVAKLPAPKDEQIANVYITTGLVAHHFFEHVTKDAKNDLSKMRQLTEDAFDEYLEAAIDATGLILRQPESTSDLATFRRQLKESMLAFIEIMEAKEWTPVGCELQFPEKEEDALTLEKIGKFGARIDCLLKQDDQYVIIDFKWSYSKKYGEKLEKNTAIQLALYRKAIEKTYPDKKIAGVGYYLMPKKQLLTTDFDEIPHTKLIQRIEPANTDDLFARIQNSYEFRMDEIKRGHIEEGETMDFLNDADSYYGKTKDLMLCPILEEKMSGRKTNRVATAAVKQSEKIFKPSKKKTFEDKKQEPSEIATSHPILKGRLK